MKTPEPKIAIPRDSAAYAQLREAVYLFSRSIPEDAFVERCKRGGLYALSTADLFPVAMAGFVIFITILMSRVTAIIGTGYPLEAVWTVCLFSLSIACFYLMRTLQVRTYLARKLDNSDLAQRLAEGPDAINQFTSAVAWPWQPLFARPARDLKGAAKLASYNAQWFIHPRSNYWDPIWMLSILAGVLLISCAIVICLAYFFVVNGGPVWIGYLGSSMILMALQADISLSLHAYSSYALAANHIERKLLRG